MAQKTRVCLWDADRSSSEQITKVLARLDDFDVIEYRSGAAQLEEIYSLKPEILLLDVDSTVPEPAEVIKELRDKLPNLHVVALSHRWDEGARARHSNEGIDYMLAKPFDVDSFLRAVENRHDVLAHIKGGKVLTFFSPKGKSGRTTLIVNLALALARASGEKVAIIDAETNFADLDAFLNIDPPSTIIEALRDLSYLQPGTLVRYFEPVNDQVSILCGAKTPQAAAYVEPEGLSKLINMTRQSFDYVLVDIAPGFNPVSVAACEASEFVYMTAMAGGLFEIQQLQRSLEIFKSMDNWQNRVSSVITRIQPDLRKAAELEEQIGCPVVLLPNEYLLCAEAANNGRMALDIGAGSKLTEQINRMAYAICEKGR